MERTEALAVGDILKAMMESNVDRHKICYLWSEVASAYINHHTTRRFVDGDTLHVFIDSGPLKSELAYMLPLFIEQLNRAVGKRIIKKISIH